MSKGWFPLFIMENLKTLKEPDLDYIEKFNTNIKRLQETKMTKNYLKKLKNWPKKKDLM